DAVSGRAYRLGAAAERRIGVLEREGDIDAVLSTGQVEPEVRRAVWRGGTVRVQGDLVDLDDARPRDGDPRQGLAAALRPRTHEGIEGARAHLVVPGLLPAQAVSDVQVAITVQVDAVDRDVLDAHEQRIVRVVDVAAAIRVLRVVGGIAPVQVDPGGARKDRKVACRAGAGDGLPPLLGDPDPHSLPLPTVHTKPPTQP